MGQGIRETGERRGFDVLEGPVIVEQWKPIPEYEQAYEVSNMGRVRSKERRVRSGARNTLVRGRILKAFPDDRGYLMVGLCKDDQKRTMKVHRLVAEAFVLGQRDGLTVHHKDMDKRNNAASNLEWVSWQDNIAMAWESGTHCPHANPKIRKKLTPREVEAIKTDRKTGITYARLGDRYGISGTTARAIVLGLLWK